MRLPPVAMRTRQSARGRTCSTNSVVTFMSTETIRHNYGYLHRVLSKRHEKDPDMEGECWIESQRYEVAGWVRLSKKSRKYLSLKFTKTDSRQ